jgi:hypothetical protein
LALSASIAIRYKIIAALFYPQNNDGLCFLRNLSANITEKLSYNVAFCPNATKFSRKKLFIFLLFDKFSGSKIIRKFFESTVKGTLRAKATLQN